jgi:D-sedoheptulose 7-phosphate isomerase
MAAMTNDMIEGILRESIETKTRLLEQHLDAIHTCGQLLADCAMSNGLIMLCGNGGSAADSQHIAAELVVRLKSDVNRRAIKALALSTDSSILTAGGNDYGFDRVFSRQVEAFGTSGDVLIAISTSGTSRNVVMAVEEARQRGVRTIGLLGGTGGVLAKLCNHSVIVPSAVTARIQECHILIGHVWCEMIEARVLGTGY